MKHSICFIDDKIPISNYGEYFNDTDIINGSIIKFLLLQNGLEWEDSVVKSLCKKLVSEPDNWAISAFTSPAFYSNYTESTVFSPEIVIFDWDYEFGPGSDSSETYLLKILQESYTMIFVFSGSDNIEEINQIIQSEKFQKFGDRLGVLNKHDANSVNEIFSQIAQKEQTNFSFSYGFDVVRNSNKAIGQVLSEISQLSISDFVESIGGKNVDGKLVSTNENFIDAIIPRYKSVLQNYHTLRDIITTAPQNSNLNNIREIWSYRLYNKSKIDIVQMGDIVRNNENDYFLILSSDCHMSDFWKKNVGFISVVPLFPIAAEKTKGYLKLKWEKKKFNNVRFTSLTNNAPISILPCVPVDEGYFDDFIIITKSIITFDVARADTSRKMLKYEDLPGYNKVTSISDPFKSPLIQFVFDNISGYGCPDFPDDLQKDLHKKIEEALS